MASRDCSWLAIVHRCVDVLGAHVKVSGDFLAGFALVHDDRVIDCWSFPAPADADEGEQLDELRRFAADLVRQHGPDRMAVKGTEAGDARSQRVAQHAEGAILTAAGAAPRPSRVWSGQAYRGALGVRNNPDALRKAEQSLSGTWPPTTEMQQAAAVALACVKKG